MPTDPKTVIYRLNDLEVQEVSMVDKPANQRKFLVVKNAAADAITAAEAAKATDDTELLIGLNPDVQKQLGGSLKAIGERCIALSTSIMAAAPLDKAEAVVPEKLAGEVENIRAAVANLIEKAPKFPPAKPAAVAPAPAPAAAAPAPAAAAPAPAAPAPAVPPVAEDETAPAVPPKGKKPPFIAADKQKADALIMALEKSDDLGDDAMQMLAMSAAREAIACASEATWRKDYSDAAKYAKTAYQLLVKYGATSIDAASQIEVVLEEFQVQKAGKKMAASRWSEFDKSLRALLALADEIEPGYTSALNKSAGNSQTLAALIQLVEQKDEQIVALKGGARRSSNTVGAGESPVPAKKNTGWPRDMNADTITESDLSFD